MPDTDLGCDNYYDGGRHCAEAAMECCCDCQCEIEYFHEDELEHCEQCDFVFCDDCLDDNGLCKECRK